MIYQKASTGFRIGASVGIIILMLGIAVAISASANAVITDQTKIITNFDEPLEKTFVQVNDIQKNKENILDDAIKFLQAKDMSGFQLTKDEFGISEGLMINELTQSSDLINMGANTLPLEYLDPNPNLTLTKIDGIERLNAAYDQSAHDLFALSDVSDKSKLNKRVNDLKDKETSLDEKQTVLLADIESSYQNIGTSIDQNKQRFLMLEIIIIASVGVISLASGHFVNQINKDLVHEVFTRTKSLQKANEKLQKLNILKDEFINEASHELKSTLNPIYGFVELAKCGDMDKEEALAGIAKQARQIEEVANKMLDLGKIDNNRLQLFIEKFDLNNLISEIVDVAKINLKEDVSIVRDLSESLEVEGDRVRIGQVIRNILNNAIKFTRKGRILVCTSNDGTNAEIEITDTGIGIHPDILPRLFNKFVTKSHKRENLEGSGLGLYICKGIIDAHMGKIHAHNNHDHHGATISFSIPLTHQANNHEIHETLIN
ncbi:MAG: HAMP domain-containing histidine kinase [Thaumarchaeota archaeon]|nr:HAMP domain-containing histidine kinase [Nitrososphaerota archaeon]